MSSSAVRDPLCFKSIDEHLHFGGFRLAEGRHAGMDVYFYGPVWHNKHVLLGPQGGGENARVIHEGKACRIFSKNRSLMLNSCRPSIFGSRAP